MFYEIEPRELSIIDRIDTEEGHIQYNLRCEAQAEECPECGSTVFNKDGTKDRMVRDLPSFGKQVGLLITLQRYKCSECGKTFYPEMESIDMHSRMTNRMKDFICEQSMVKPFLQLQEELSISDTTVKRIFDEHVKELERKRELSAPRVLGIDENHLLHQYRAVFTDVENGLIIEMLPKRNKPDIRKFLKSLPNKENTVCVTMDMWKPYKDVAQEIFPDATVVIDKFHVIKELNNTLETIRKKLRADMDKDERRHLRMSRFLLLKNKEDLSKDEEQRLKELFLDYPEFERPYRLKEQFRDIYNSQDRFKAEGAYQRWLDRAEGCGLYDDFIATVENWHMEIFNYFDMPYTNATTEYLNSVINRINDTGRGYSFAVLRAKALFGTKASKPAKYKFVKPTPIPSGAVSFATPSDMFGHTVLVHGAGTDIKELYRLLEHNGIMEL